MKKIVFMFKYSLERSYFKLYLMDKYKDSIIINDSSNMIINLNNEDIMIIFKKINLNRPADLYKYSNDTKFIYATPSIQAIEELSNLLTKKRDFKKLDFYENYGLNIAEIA